jgi:DNA repair exonuclease SbcCD nuclease subunit
MQPFRFLHTADVHLGTPFAGLADKVPQQWKDRLQEAAYTVFRRIVALAIEHEVQFLTIAGDLLDAAVVPMSVFFELRRCFEQLAEARIRVFITHGNHDPALPLTDYAWPDNVFVFPPIPAVIPASYEVPTHVFELAPGTRVQVSGFSYRQAELFTAMTPYFVRQPGVDYAIGLYHGAVGSHGEHPNYAATTVSELVKRDFDFWGLGHIHQPQLLRSSHPVVVYPGNPQGRHSKERGERGVCLVSVDASGATDVQWLPTQTIFWAELAVSADEVDDWMALRQRIHDQVRQLVVSQGRQSEGVFLILSLKGSTSLHSSLQHQVPQLWEALQDDFDQLGWPVCIARLELDTRPPVDVSTLVHSQAFVGEVLRSVASYRSNPSEARQLLASVLPDLFHPGTGLSLTDVTEVEVNRLLDDVEGVILAALEGAVDER